jgi:hypothetical protein
VFDVKVSGKSFIPQNRNFLVVANHASHLDMGLVKVVLGDQGERLTALAARDYFFERRSSAPTSRTSPTSSPWTGRARCVSS